MDPKLISRVVRQAFPGRNGLATAGDRLEGAVLAAAVVVALLAVPVAAAAGSEFHARQQAQVVSEQQTSERAQAVLIEDAPPSMEVDDRGTVLEFAPVRATWLGPDGFERQGTVQAHYGAVAGSTVPIWIDRRGDATEPPLTAAAASIMAIGLAVLLWTAVTAAFVLLFLVIRLGHTGLRIRRWELEWKRVSRDWTAR